MFWRKLALVVMIGSVGLSLPAAAQIAESLRSQYHKQEELGVQVVSPSNLAGLDGLVRNPGNHVICLQCMVEDVSEPQAMLMLDWVRDGHSLWLYDSRLAAKYFGFADYPLKKEQFRVKEESGVLGGRKYEGAATVALAMGEDVLLTGVGEAQVFLPHIEDGDRYPAVEVKGDTIPLLRFAPDSPAVSALRKEGRGLIVLKPLLWTIPYSGERFQLNVLEFSAGYQIPGIGGDGLVGSPPGPRAEYVVGQPASPVAGASIRVPATPMPPDPGATSTASTPTAAASTGRDRVSLGGDVVEGTIVNEEFRFETGGSSMRLKKADIKRVDLGGTLDLDRLTTTRGETFKGMLIDRKIEVENKDGRQVLEKKDINSIEFGLPADAP